MLSCKLHAALLLPKPRPGREERPQETLAQVLTKAEQPLMPPGGAEGNYSLVTLTDQPGKTCQTATQPAQCCPLHKNGSSLRGGSRAPQLIRFRQTYTFPASTSASRMESTWTQSRVGGSFHSQHLLRDGGELDSAGVEENQPSQKHCLGDPGTVSHREGISTPYVVLPSVDVSAFHPGAQRNITIDSLEKGLESC